MSGGHADAAAWLARLHAEDRTAEDVAAFRAWLDRDPANGSRFEHLTGVWEQVGGLGEIERAPIHARAVSRRAVLAGGLGLAVAGGAGFWALALPDAAYATALGERRGLTLADGSRLLMNTSTVLEVRFDRGHRRIDLKQGQVLLDIASDPRPFLVEVPGGMLRADRGRFDIRSDAEFTAYFAVAGSAHVERGAGASLSLRSGERLRADLGSAPKIDHPEPRDLLAWQDGRAVFRETRLADAVREMNRYSRLPVVLVGEAVGEERLSGVYRVGDNAAFAKALAMLLPVRAISSGREITVRPANG
jgi:transmembrane sensor